MTYESAETYSVEVPNDVAPILEEVIEYVTGVNEVVLQLTISLIGVIQ